MRLKAYAPDQLLELSGEDSEFWPYWSKCGLAEVGLALLEVVSHWESAGFNVSKAHIKPRLSLPAVCRSGYKTLDYCSGTMPTCFSPRWTNSLQLIWLLAVTFMQIYKEKFKMFSLKRKRIKKM